MRNPSPQATSASGNEPAVHQETSPARTRQLEEYAGHIEEMREIEKRELATALHNEFGSALTALSMRLGIMARLIPDSPPVAEQWVKVHALLGVLAKTARRTQNQLRPASLDVMGLKTAIAEQVHEFEDDAQIACSIAMPEQEVDPGEGRALALLRMLQEILSNVMRHSGAKNVSVGLLQESGKITLTVSDDGIGFDVPACDFRKTHGLRSIRERAEFLGGTLVIDSAQGLGTTIRIQLALPE